MKPVSSLATNPAESQIDIVRTRTALRDQVDNWRAQGLKIALVPTMGALHDGHLDLVAEAHNHADRVITSIFVNPTQFAPHEDLARYPRQEAKDAELLANAGGHLIYAPAADQIYPDGFATTVSVAGITDRLEGSFRPHFFAGVATVVTKLFTQTRPDVALFGEKDWQQLQMVQRLVVDLDLAVSIIPVPTRREADGLAMSSRNAYLTPEERAQAPILYRTIQSIAKARHQSADALADVIERSKSEVIDSGFAKIDYLELCDAATLGPCAPDRPARVLVAALLGKTRLIDNCAA